MKEVLPENKSLFLLYVVYVGPYKGTVLLLLLIPLCPALPIPCVYIHIGNFCSAWLDLETEISSCLLPLWGRKG